MTGAVTLAGRAALRAGAGIVVAGIPGDAARTASGSEIITRSLPATAAGALDEDAAKEVLDGLDRFRVLVVGPGLGQAPPTVAAVRRLVAEAPIPLVLDADGLNALGGDLDILASRPAATVVTPHAGEYARLAGEPVGEDRVAAARRLAERSGAVVLLKGSRTVVADPTGRAAVNLTGGPWLATAGTGDVLSGVVGALAALGLPAFRAAVAGAWIHGRAGDVWEPHQPHPRHTRATPASWPATSSTPCLPFSPDWGHHHEQAPELPEPLEAATMSPTAAIHPFPNPSRAVREGEYPLGRRQQPGCCSPHQVQSPTRRSGVSRHLRVVHAVEAVAPGVG